MSETKTGLKGNLKLYIIAALAFVVIGAGLFFAKTPSTPGELAGIETPAATVEASAPSNPQSTEPPQAQNETAPAAPATSTAAAPVAPAATSIDVNAALSDRIIGDTSAPVRISEHASLTCSHCGDFHRNVFDKFKKDFIDTKKAYINFSDFPLNQPALDAAMIARCLPEAKYFDYLHMLFKTQEDWVYDKNYKDYLKKTASKEGMTDAQFDACLASKELAEGIKNRMKGSSQQWGINATPTFVINNKTVISGASSYEDFKKIVEEETARIKAANQAAAAAPKETVPPAAEADANKTEAPAATPETPVEPEKTSESAGDTVKESDAEAVKETVPSAAAPKPAEQPAGQ